MNSFYLILIVLVILVLILIAGRTFFLDPFSKDSVSSISDNIEKEEENNTIIFEPVNSTLILETHPTETAVFIEGNFLRIRINKEYS